MSLYLASHGSTVVKRSRDEPELKPPPLPPAASGFWPTWRISAASPALRSGDCGPTAAGE